MSLRTSTVVDFVAVRPQRSPAFNSHRSLSLHRRRKTPTLFESGWWFGRRLTTRIHFTLAAFRPLCPKVASLASLQMQLALIGRAIEVCPVAGHNPLTDFRRTLALLGLLVSVEDLALANVTARSLSSNKAIVQTLVAVRTVTIAVARFLV